MDLTDLIASDTDFTEENYYMNIIEQMKYNGKSYCIPADFTMPCAYVNGNIINESGVKADSFNKDVWTYSSLQSLFEEVKAKRNTTYMECMDGLDLFGQFFRGKEFIDLESKAVNLKSPEFINFLNDTRAMQDKGYLNDEADYKDKLIAFVVGSGATIFMQDYYDGGQEKNIQLKPLADDGGNIIVEANNKFTVSQSSKNKDLAYQFLKFAVSEEMQEKPDLIGFRLNKKAQSSVLNQYVSSWVEAKSSEGAKFKVSNDEIVKEAQDHLNTWCAKVSGYNMISDELEDAMIDDLMAYYRGSASGSLTAEQVANNLQNKVYTMLNE